VGQDCLLVGRDPLAGDESLFLPDMPDCHNHPTVLFAVQFRRSMGCVG
jgi:hypothetical protein